MRKFLFLLILPCLSKAEAEPSQKAVVGVTEVQTAAQNISCSGWEAVYGADCNAYLSSGFRTMLETAIFKTGKMGVLERARMDVFEERALGQTGLTDAGGQIGGVAGADYLVYGSITKFGMKYGGFSLKGGDKKKKGLLGSGLATSTITVEMGVDIKVTDVDNGQIVIADHVQGKVKEGQGFFVGGITSVENSADPFADVQRVVAAKIAEALVTYRYPIKVIKIQDNGLLILNYGEIFFSKGDRLAMFEVGESFVDPDTGERLGAEETLLGTAKIVSVDKRFARAKIVGDKFDAPVGSTLKRISKRQAKDIEKRKRSGAKLD